MRRWERAPGVTRGTACRPAKRAGLPRPPMQVLLFGSGPLLLSRDSQRPRHACAVSWVRPCAVLHMALLDVRPCITHRAGGVLEQRLPRRRSHLAEQMARVFPVVGIDATVPMRSYAVHRHRLLGEIGLIVPQPGAVG